MPHYMILRNNSGMMALVTLIIFTVIILAIAVSLNALGIGQLAVSYLQTKSAWSFGTADTCMENALLRLQNDAAYTGESLTLGSSSCTITVALQQDGSYLIQTQSLVQNAVRRIRVQTVRDRVGNLAVQSWGEE